jgi:riboflavin kinase/FMN adenylyltransferase
VTVGSFDGVHRGHLAILAALRRRAAAAGVAAEVLTFDPHPLEILRPPDAPPLLTEVAEKVDLLSAAGVDRVHVRPFTPSFASLEAGEFVRDVLAGELGASAVVVGEGHRFGRARGGGTGELRSLAAGLDVEIEVVPTLRVGGEPVSSTRIRRAVSEGRLDDAEALLGRRYGVSGVVVRGSGRGASLGVPTANVAVPRRKLLPPEGVYAARARLDGRTFAAAVHWGARPTFGEEGPVLEAHLLGWEGGPLYGRRLEVGFVERLRDVVRFETAEELAREMESDLRRAAAVAGAP